MSADRKQCRDRSLGQHLNIPSACRPKVRVCAKCELRRRKPMNAQSATSMSRFRVKRRNYRTVALWAVIGAVAALFLLLVFVGWDVVVAHYILV
jgi:hypothetical protein